MKRITLMALLLLAGYVGHAQYSYEGIDDYGRLSGLVYDLETEDKVYAISRKNHIVVSYDNGQTWDVEYTFPDTRATITNLKMLPGNENLFFTILYAEELDGMYILNIEANQIINHITLPAQEENPTLNDIYVYDADASTMIIHLSVMSGGKVFYTTTGGESWSEVYDMVENSNIAPTTVAISPDNPSKLFIGRGPDPASATGGGGLFISEDAGETWIAKVSGNLITAIGFDPEDANDIMVSSGYFSNDMEKLYRSLDGGETFTEIPMEWTPLVTNNVIDIIYHPVVPGTIFVLEENEIIFTENDGETWTSTAYPEEEYYSGLSLTLNPFYNKEALIATDNFPRRTINGGTTLTQIKSPYYQADGINVVKYDGVDNLYYTAQGGHHHKDYSTGSTGAYNAFPSSNSQFLRNQVIPDPANEGRVIIHDFSNLTGGKTFISFDHGATRTEFASNWMNVLTSMATDPQNNNIVYVALYNYQNNELYRLDISDPENITHEIVQTPTTIVEGNPQTFGNISAIMFPTGESGTIMIACQNGIYKTTDAGITWTEISKIESIDIIRDVAVNPFDANNFSAATDIGLFTTTDGGQTWSHNLEGIEVANVKYSDIQNGIKAVSVVNSYPGSYIYYFNGTDWVKVMEGELNYVQATSMDFSFDASNNINAYIGTIDVGVVRYAFEIGELGIDNPHVDASNVIVAPNPATGLVQVSATGGHSINNVSLYSITGQKILQLNSATIDVSSLSSGIYIIKAETSDGKIVSKKLVKKQ